MKKNLIISCIILMTSALSAVAVITRETQEIFTPIFVSRFLKCIPCKMDQTITTENGTVKISRKLRNWQGHKCRYSETYVDEKGKVEDFSCNLSREQVNALVSAMKLDPENKKEALKAWSAVKKDKASCQIKE